ncbi:hypothetical protein DQ384_25110 [Sphaerisporangium album]|uniref:AMIN-like domain-containing protein n=1 Tax=Sphaerisporangium album TaxID=509200 RepID=A0A367FDQ3_9ACTN|nr:hypothetical protein [Sphaerisporangium album]RCG27815.1 hypothetical protein DQ384_25110 [Sphaerisporangium album]
MRSTAVAAALLPLALLTACGGGTGGSPEATVTTTVSVTPSAGSTVPPSGSPVTPDATAPGTPSPIPSREHTAATPDLPPPSGTGPVEVKRSPQRPPLVTGVRFAAHPGFDRVVVDLRGAPTGYHVRWVTQLLQDGSGDPVEVKGGAYLQVALNPASAHTEDGKPTWQRIQKAGLPNVRSVVRTGDFEGTVTLGLVLGHRAGFRVDEQSAPYRLVIDIAH